jgi:hypothetical protein
VDGALDALAQAARTPAFDPAWARQDADLLWLYDDPRFAALLDAAEREREAEHGAE